MQKHVHTLIVGSGAAGLSAAVHLKRLGVSDILIATESLAGGTSINTGSDKQTYYKMACCGAQADSVRDMAETYFAGGSMHGDLALAEAAGSLRAFMNLVELGVPFPRDEYGQFAGYKTDHDPRQRATSCGPYTSREMCRALIREARRLEIPVQEGFFIRELLTENLVSEESIPSQKRVTGAVFADVNGVWHTVYAKNTVFAVGGPGGLYKTSVYPKVHLGAIGVALCAGAVAQNLPESQFGLASTAFRWNVSGTYMQCVPRFLSTAADGTSDVREFFMEHAATEKISPGELHSLIFLKGYQWPFDARKIRDPHTAAPLSSMLDIWVYEETVLRNRRIFLDFRQNPEHFQPEKLSAEARAYLKNSGAFTLPTPLARLEKMNPDAIRLYVDHGIFLECEPLEIAVCAQHNNGGLAADHHWQSVNLRNFFPVGEVNGSHGVTRPGGSALNAGQVGALRAAEFIARNAAKDLSQNVSITETADIQETPGVAESQETARGDWRAQRDAFQRRMSRAGAFIRRKSDVENAISETRQLLRKTPPDAADRETHRNAYLLTAQLLTLDAIRFQLASGVGSRGGAVVLADEKSEAVQNAAHEIFLNGQPVRILPEDPEFRRRVLESWLDAAGNPHHRWVPRREIPEPDTWFENVWAKFNAECEMRNAK